MNEMKLDVKKFSEIGLIYSLGLFPLLKILSLYLTFVIPLHYFFIVIFTYILTFEQLFKKNRLFFVANLFVTVYCVLTWFHVVIPLMNPNYKMFVAGYTFVNLLLVFFEAAKKETFKDYLGLYLNFLAYISLLIFSLMIIAGIILCLRYPYDWSLDNVFGLLTFSRDQVAFRSSLILRINPLGLFTDDIGNVGYIGPQLLIQPLIYTLLKITGITKQARSKIPQYLSIIIYTLLTAAVLILNTRAFALVLVAFLLIKFINVKSINLKRLATILFFIFPFSIYMLSSKQISLRNCQYDFVMSELTPLGNGIGFDVDILNNLCSNGNVSMDKLNSTLTFSYDNIHLEFIHYFGYLMYLALLLLILFNVRDNKNYLYFMTFTFVFLALNFNLFEVVMAPMILILYFYTYHQKSDESLS